MKESSVIGFGIFTVLNGLDYYLTKRILDSGGRELNPVVNKVGIGRSKVLSIVSGAALAYCGCKVFIPLNLLMSGVCLWNYLQIRKVEKSKSRSEIKK